LPATPILFVGVAQYATRSLAAILQQFDFIFLIHGLEVHQASMTVTKWATVARQCLLRRLSVHQFRELLKDREIDGSRLFAALVHCREFMCAPRDPLVSLYIEYLGSAGILPVWQAVLVLAKRWNSSAGQLSQDALTCYADTLQDLAMVVDSPKQAMDVPDAHKALVISTRWLSSVARQASHEDADASHLAYGRTVESLAIFLTSLATTETGLKALSLHLPSKLDELEPAVKSLRVSTRQALELCLPLYTMLSSQLMERILKHINLLDDGAAQNNDSSAQAAEIQGLQFQVSIAESQVVASRAGTILFLETLLLSGSMIDDATAINWLSTRHNNDYLAMFVDIVTGSFAVLKSLDSAAGRALCLQQCHVFIRNKLPALLSMISATSFNSFSTEQALTDAWQQVAPLIADQNLLIVGAHFLHFCSLLHLLPGPVVVQLVGDEELVKNLSKGLYTKDVLVDQVNSNHTRGVKLVDELVRAEGSAGFISQAIVQVRMPLSKTISLD
jgi:hypothetical protein